MCLKTSVRKGTGRLKCIEMWRTDISDVLTFRKIYQDYTKLKNIDNSLIDLPNYAILCQNRDALPPKRSLETFISE